MAHVASRRSRAFSVITMMLALLLPCTASASWGDENWGEMVWGAAAIPVPALSIKGLIALVLVLTIVPSALLARRRWGSKQ